MTTQDMRRLTLTTDELHTLQRWLKIIQLEEPSQGAWILDKTEFDLMKRLNNKIRKLLT